MFVSVFIASDAYVTAMNSGKDISVAAPLLWKGRVLEIRRNRHGTLARVHWYYTYDDAEAGLKRLVFNFRSMKYFFAD